MTTLAQPLAEATRPPAEPSRDRPRDRRRIPALPTLSLDLLALGMAPFWGSRRLAFPLDRLRPSEAGLDGEHRSRAALYYLARNGVHHGLGALGIGAGDEVLMPSYHHGVEVEAVCSTGAKPIFYRVSGAWEADLDDARARARSAKRPRALYLVHYAGWPQAVESAVALARELGLDLVEDCALALGSRDPDGTPLGARGDLAVFCLYKTLPVPHGGLALARAQLPAGHAPPPWSTLHHVGGSLRARALLGRGPSRLLEAARSLARGTVDRVVDHQRIGTQHLDRAQLGLGASSLVARMLPRFDLDGIAVRRRRNYHELLRALGDDRLVPAPLPPRACPLFFPLLVGDKRRARDEADALGVEAIDFWRRGDAACAESDFPETRWARRHVLELPLHQDLDDEAMERVAAVAKSILARAGRAPR